MQHIGKNLKERAEELNLSNGEIARRLGISAQRYSNYVNDKRQPDFSMLKKICKVLNISYNDLFAE